MGHLEAGYDWVAGLGGILRPSQPPTADRQTGTQSVNWMDRVFQGVHQGDSAHATRVKCPHQAPLAHHYLATMENAGRQSQNDSASEVFRPSALIFVAEMGARCGRGGPHCRGRILASKFPDFPIFLPLPDRPARPY